METIVRKCGESNLDLACPFAQPTLESNGVRVVWNQCLVNVMFQVKHPFFNMHVAM